MSITGERDDLPGGGPQRVGVPIVDIMTGMYATIAVCAALAHRAETGIGQHLDLALLDTQVAFLANQAMNYLATGESPGRLGNAHPNIVPYQTFKTADGDIILACGNDNLFGKFCEVGGLPELADGPALRHQRQARRESRGAHAAARRDRSRSARRATGSRRSRRPASPNGPINNIEQVFEEPQVIARGLRIELRAPDGGQGAAGREARCDSPRRRSSTSCRRRSSASTPTRSCAACWACRKTRSPGCAPTASSKSRRGPHLLVRRNGREPAARFGGGHPSSHPNSAPRT